VKCTVYIRIRFQEVRNARIVAAYNDRLTAVKQVDLTQRRPLVGMSAVARAASIAKQLRQQQIEQTAAAKSDPQYFLRQRVVIGLCACHPINTTAININTNTDTIVIIITTCAP